MCGIFGFAGAPDRADAIDLGIAIQALRHRGPDGDGTYRGRTGDVAVALAHTRLAIIDLSPLGKQPMTTDDGRFTLVYNGEVYNFREIRRELEALGHSFRSTSDSEVVLKAYAAWGKTCVERFRGMFAFAIWDAKEASLFFARDRFGIKPFYYTKTKDGLAFSSEVRTLMKSGLAAKTLSPAGLESYFTWGSVADPLTLVENVFSVIPAHRGFWRNGELSFERYWDFPEGGTRDIRFDEAVEELRPILRESIAKELISDVPLGVFLSGGIDSSAIVAMAAEVSPRPVHTFTVTFEDEKYNEAPYARQVADRFSCVHTEVHVTAEKALAEFGRAAASYDQPSADGVNTWFVAKAAREAGLSVALSGLGGDEIFAGYSNFRIFGRLLRAGRIAGSLGKRIAPLFGTSSFNGTSMRVKRMGEVLRAGGDVDSTYRALRCLFTRGQRRALNADTARNASEAPDAPLSSDRDVRGVDSVALFSRLELTNYVRHTLLRDSDQMSMAHSLEVRVPLLDHVVAEMVIGLTAALKLPASGRSSGARRTSNKPLLVAAAPDLPASIVQRRKSGFTLPFDRWVRDELRDPISAMIDAVPLNADVVSRLATTPLSTSGTLALAALGSWTRSWS